MSNDLLAGAAQHYRGRKKSDIDVQGAGKGGIRVGSKGENVSSEAFLLQKELAPPHGRRRINF